MASFSDAVYIMHRPRSHPAHPDFLEPVIAQVQLGHRFPEILVLTPESDNFADVGLMNRIARETQLADFQKILAPALIQVGFNTTPAT
jgi:hypothetical protein